MLAKPARGWVIFGLLLSVALMAFFPQPFGQGPFNSVNGPTTAFRAYRSAVAILTALAMFAAALAARLLMPFAVMTKERAEIVNALVPPEPFVSCAILRC
jgi:hypothetical protein